MDSHQYHSVKSYWRQLQHFGLLLYLLLKDVLVNGIDDWSDRKAFVCHLKITNIRLISHHVVTSVVNTAKQSDLQIYFRSPKELLEKYVKNLSSVLDFQSSHSQYLQKAKQEQAGSSHELLSKLAGISIHQNY
uniref:Uncharacterized protein n=1 Tax=Onchocerca volvulus TaxID=6282 RepID=A0A8R1XQ27_ONCVO